MKSWTKPTPEQVDRAISLLGQVQNIRYFFDKLENPEWITPLYKKGYFSHPPELSKNEEQGTIGFPPWPASSYLARMAALKPKEVLDIITKIPDTENIRVCEDFLEALIKIPPEIAIKLNNKVKKWIKLPYQFIYPEKLGDLILHLANGGQIDHALDLAKSVFKVLPGKKSDIKSVTSDFDLRPEPVANFNSYDYELIIKKCFPEFLDTVGLSGLKLLCGLLDKVIFLSQEKNKAEKIEDYSYIWRPAIEDHEQNLDSGIKNILITAVRYSSDYLITKKISSVSTVIDTFEKFKWKIYLRFKIYILIKFGDCALDLVSNILTNKEMFNDYTIQHEFVALIQSFFKKISKDKQNLILDWINKGPNLEKIKKTIQDQEGKQPTKEELTKIKEKWQLKRMDWMKDSLKDTLKNYFYKLTKEYGEPEHSDFASYGFSWVGPTSPKTIEELNNMSPTEIINFLKNWVPSNQYSAPTPEGLGRTLTEAIKNRSSLFSSMSLYFKPLDPTYIRALVTGLAESKKDSQTFKWDPLLELCEWVVNQPRSISKLQKQRNRDSDPDWGWTRKSIVDLLVSGFSNNILPFSYREKAWQILKSLTDDPEPSQEYENEYSSTKIDPATLSINTVRGKAMHAVIQYALWIRRHHEKRPDAKNYINGGFSKLSKVREILNKHLDFSLDPSLTIRSVYGRWLPWIILLDKKWTINKLSVIFPSEKNKSLLWDSAWESYVIFCRPYDNVLDILSKQYQEAVDKLKLTEELQSHFNPRDRLAEHLMEFYWRGKIDFDNYNNLFINFWLKANPELRGYALEFIGRNLKNTKLKVPQKTIKMLILLWEKRLSEAKESKNKTAFKYEMNAFEWWFISEKFNDKWALEQLIEALRIGGRVNMHLDKEIVNRLDRFVDISPRETIQCLELIAKSDKEGWGIHLWQDKAKLILIKALKTNAAEDAKSLINYFGRRGYFSFRDLLEQAY